MIKSSNNGKVYNLALCDEGKKVKLFLQFDIDGDGDPDVVTSFMTKKLGGDIEGDIIEKLRRFFDVLGYPEVLIAISSLKVDVERWRARFPEIKRIDVMLPEKTNEVKPGEIWYLTITAVHSYVFMVLRNSKKVLQKNRVTLPVPSVAEEIKDFLLRAFNQFKYPEKIINESPDRFSFEENFKPDWFEEIVINIIPVDGKEHLLIKEK